MAGRAAKVVLSVGTMGAALMAAVYAYQNVEKKTDDSDKKLTPEEIGNAVPPAHAKGMKGYSEGVLEPARQGIFARLPTQWMYEVMTYLQLHETTALQRVCKEWKEMMIMVRVDRAYLKHCAKQGFGERWRGNCWKLLAGVPQLTQQRAKMYKELLSCDKVPSALKSAEDISRDDARTIIHYLHFNGNEELARETLGRVLNAYAVHDDKLGYTQGMNFIVAFLLTKLEEEEAYWFFYTLMVSERFRVRGMFDRGLPSLKVCQYQFQRFLEFFLPKLSEHFSRLQISAELYATEWFMTLFTYRAIPLSCTARIWDVFLVDGWKAVHRVALAILYLSQDTLLTLEFEDAIRYLKNFPDQGIFIPEILLAEARHFKVTNRMLRRLAMQYAGETRLQSIPV